MSMFHSSTQRTYWTFANQEELDSHRKASHHRFIEERLRQKDCAAAVKLTTGLDAPYTDDMWDNLDQEAVAESFLTLREEFEMRRFFQTMLREFCAKFKPEMPKSTIATGFAFFQRAYLNESVMRFHPKNMMITCMWIAVKVDEFHVSMEQFISHLRGDRQKAMDIILYNEPYVMQKLHFHLMVHLPYRSYEGFFIDIRARYRDKLKQSPEKLRPIIDKFLDQSMFSDALLLYSPSQIGLAAIFHAAEELREDLTGYIENVLVQHPITKPFSEADDSEARAEEVMDQDGAEHGTRNSIHLLAVIDEIRHHVTESAKQTVSKDQIKKLEAKLESCKDPAFNPETEEYQRRLVSLFQMEVDEKFE